MRNSAQRQLLHIVLGFVTLVSVRAVCLTTAFHLLPLSALAQESSPTGPMERTDAGVTKAIPTPTQRDPGELLDGLDDLLRRDGFDV